MSPILAKRLARLERMSPRERLVVTVCLCALTWFVANTFFIAPAERERAALGDLMETQRQALADASQQLEGLRSGSVPPGDPELRQQLAQLDKDNLSADASLRASQQYLVPAETMNVLLQDLLRHDSRLDLVSIETLPVSPILDTSKAEASAPTAESPDASQSNAKVMDGRGAAPVVETTMFRHGVKLVVRGNFLNVLEYLHAVEKMPRQMYWGSFQMDTPAGEAGEARSLPVYSVSIYTLSLDKSWLKL